MKSITNASRRLAILLLSVLSPLALAAPTQDETNPEGRYIVQFRSFQGASAAVRAAGGNPVLELSSQSAIAAYLPPQAIEALQRNPNVSLIEQDARRYPMAQVKPYGISMVHADRLSDSAAGNATVCIIDSGYDVGHEDLQTTRISGGGNGWDADLCGHGTHVAGTIAGLANDRGVVGVLPNGNVNLHIRKVFDGTGCAWSYASTLVQALEACRQNVSPQGSNAGTNLVVSMSLGGSTASSVEDAAFANAYANNVLSVAAAGNGGSRRNSYPASYNSVISVGAVDSAGVVASFSQYNSQVELAAPGVAVRSTVPMGSGMDVFIAVGTTSYSAGLMDGSPGGTAAGALTNCGLGGPVGTQCAGATGKVCLYERGTYNFAEKVLHCELGGGSAAIIYNNVAGSFSGTLSGTETTIPSFSISQADGQALVGQVGEVATASVLVDSNYESWDGTSMATPHVAGVAALIWSHHPTKKNSDVRTAMTSTALDKGAKGRDVYYGFGIVQAEAALAALTSGGGGGGGGTTITLTATVKKATRTTPKLVELKWSGATGIASVDVMRNDAWIATTSASTGLYKDTPSAAGTYRYKVCPAGTSTGCSNEVSVRF